MNYCVIEATRDGTDSVRFEENEKSFYIEHKRDMTNIDKTLEIWLNIFVSNVKSRPLKEIESNIMSKCDMNQD